ncbi:MAG: 4Fe-4S dicluster domain-containing protein [Terriglobales bacterium]|jgi:heterodisulfide reductase subunit C
MKRNTSPTRQIFPVELLAKGHDELKDIPDDELVSAYESMRDQEAAAGHAYPNIKRLYGTSLEREKDRRETRAQVENGDSEMQEWYEKARNQPCTWWLKNHLVAKHALKSCIACGVCTAQCPAAQYYPEYNPRTIVDAALSENEDRLVELLKSDVLWYCGQCGSCKPKCSRENNLMGLISSLRFLAQLKGYHLCSVRGRQQYAARHLWGGNLWNRGCSLYFRNVDAEGHPDFGPRYARYHSEIDQQMSRLGASPDADGQFGGRKVSPETLAELRSCVTEGGTLVLWNELEKHASENAEKNGVSIDEYYDRVRCEG